MTSRMVFPVAEIMFLVVVALIVARGTDGIIIHKDMTLKDTFTKFETFGFQRGGSMDITVTAQNTSIPELFLVICLEREYSKVLRRYPTDTELCSRLDDLPCHFRARIQGDFHHVGEVVEPGMHIFFFAASCGLSKLDVEMEYTLLNPGGEHLSTSEIPLPSMSMTFMIVWGLVLLAWMHNWFTHREQKILLHRIICLIPFIKFLYMNYRIYYWMKFSREGEITHIDRALYEASIALSEMILYTVVLLVSKGYCITRGTIMLTEKKAIGVVVITLASAALLYRLLQSYYLFALVIMYIVVFKYTFAGLQYHIMTLKSQLLLIGQYLPNVNDTPVSEKYKVFKSFQVALVVFVFVNSLFLVVVVFFLNYYHWVEVLLKETVELGLLIFLGYLFRLRIYEPPSQPSNDVEMQPLPLEKSPSLVILIFPPNVTNGIAAPSMAFAVQEGEESKWNLEQLPEGAGVFS